MPKTVRGSCLCGGIRYEVSGPFLRASHCHCWLCRKHSGAATCAQARVAREHFTLLSGAELLRVYAREDYAVKAFCTVCGSSVFGGTWPVGDEVSIRMGSFDDDPGVRPQWHTFVAGRPAWDVIADDLPQYDEDKPAT